MAYGHSFGRDGRRRRCHCSRLDREANGQGYITAHGEAAAVAGIRSARWLALLSERLTPKRQDCAVLAGKSTLNRLEPRRLGAPTRYHGIKQLALT